MKTVWASASWLLLGAVLRGLALWLFAGDLDADIDQYRGIAWHLARGEGFLSPEGIPTAYRPPLYPLLLAGILAAGGGSIGIGLVQLLLGVATIWLTLELGKRMRLGRSRFIAAAIVAVDPLLIHNTTLIMTETLATCLSALLLWWMTPGIPDAGADAGAAQIEPGAGDEPRRSWSWYLALGVLMGLCCLCRPTFWAFGALLLAGGVGQALWSTRLKSAASPDSGRKQNLAGMRGSCLVLAGMAAVIGPWAARNLYVLGSPVATTTHGGYTLLLGHNPVYYRDVLQSGKPPVWEERSLLDWQSSLEVRMQRELPNPRDELARDRWMYREAWHNIFAEPWLAVKSGASLLARLWGLTPGRLPAARGAELLKLGIGGFYLLMFAALCAGLFHLRSTEWRRWWPLAALLLSFSIVHCLYWSDMRMRAPLVPAIALLAARGLKKGERQT